MKTWFPASSAVGSEWSHLHQNLLAVLEVRETHVHVWLSKKGSLSSCPGLLSLVPGTEGTRLKPPTPPAFGFIKLEAECWGNDPWQPSYVVMPPLNSQIMYKTNITFYASYWTEHMKRKTTQQWHNLLCGMKRQGFITCTTSFSSYASSLDKFWRRTYLSSGSCLFHNFSVALNRNVNEPLCYKVTGTVDRK